MAEPVSSADLILRLKRIEGQVRGIQRMVEEDRACPEVLSQLSAINEAVRRVSVLMAERYAFDCLDETSQTNQDAAKSRARLAALIDALTKAPR
jgi:CsoR family transcriptional regulator, copper-sensing transcriptional repressor